MGVRGAAGPIHINSANHSLSAQIDSLNYMRRTVTERLVRDVFDKYAGLINIKEGGSNTRWKRHRLNWHSYSLVIPTTVLVSNLRLSRPPASASPRIFGSFHLNSLKSRLAPCLVL
jgi:hypothetical protein